MRVGRDLPKNGEKKGPWEVKESRVTYENAWISVREDKVIRPDGKDGIYGVVDIMPGITVIAIDSEGNAIMTESYEYALEKVSIEGVSGGLNEGEEPLAGAKRELIEEIGFEAREWTDLGRVDPFTSIVYSPTQLFLARKLTNSEANLEGTESLKVRKIPFEKVVEMAMNGEITHGESVVAILKAKIWLDRQK